MHGATVAFITVLSVLLLLVGVAVLYIFFSPMFVPRLLRRSFGNEEGTTYPDGFDEQIKAVNIQRDIHYESGYGKNTLDLYTVEKEEPAPLILWVHGGAFVAGDKSGVENWGVMLAANGYAVAAMNYEWAPRAAYPAQLIQITQAIEKLQKISKENNLDMSRFVIAGDSAGAHMAAQFAIALKNRDYAKRLGIIPPIEPQHLRAALLYCGPYDLNKISEYNNRLVKFFINRIGRCYMGRWSWLKCPLSDTLTCKNFVTGDCVPLYLTDGNTGSFESHAKELSAAVKSCGVEVAERYFDSAVGTVHHEYQMKLDEENAQQCFADSLEFLSKHTKLLRETKNEQI